MHLLSSKPNNLAILAMSAWLNFRHTFRYTLQLCVDCYLEVPSDALDANPLVFNVRVTPGLLVLRKA